MQKVYYYPSASRQGYENPYSINFKKALSKYYDVCDAKNKPSLMLTLTFLCHSLIADVFVINWLESAPFLKLGKVQYLFACLALTIIKLRKKKLIWILHNIHPHSGTNKQSEHLQQRLFSEAALVVSHSKEAFKWAESQAVGKCLFFPHPVQDISCTESKSDYPKSDILIWGAVLPYKGIYEFISMKEIQDSDFNIHIIGQCKNLKLEQKINSCCSDHIHYENRKADFSELSKRIQSCKYVLFPYIGDSVSSSGALIDTLVLGGNPVGPNKGAFSDLSKTGVCLTYSNKSDLFQILQSDRTISKDARISFLQSNSWDSFVGNIISRV